MKIAIISSYHHHMECVGFLIDSLIDESHDITFLTSGDSYGYDKYFLSLYDSAFKKGQLRNFNSDDYNVIIKLTATDDVIKSTQKRNHDHILIKTISIVHMTGWTDKSAAKIVLSPYVKFKSLGTQVTPVYQGLTFRNEELKKNILWIGQLEDKWIDLDMINFIKKTDCHFTFILSTSSGRGKLIKDLDNVTIMTRISTERMIQLILASDMIMCRKFPHQSMKKYSGSFVLGLSHDKPMIMNKKMSDDYRIPGITFEENYSELVDYINNLTIEQLDSHIEESIECKNQASLQNKEKIRNLIEEVVQKS